MAGKNIVTEVDSLIRPVVDGAGCELYDLVFAKEGANWYLRVFIDKPGGVTIDDCERVSRAVEKELDAKDPIEQSYILEVSSPGLDRPLKKDADFERFKDSMVEVRLYKPRGGRKEFTGRLAGLLDGNVVIIDGSGNELRFPKPDVALCRLAVVF
ncbi:MAG: ribosome maturation factor RimP [Clostridiales bacterium]|nr:ribosome maturation factor RimP [Clostridiales bacterium]